MSNLLPSCRLCDSSYSARETGCDVCKPAKAAMRMPQLAIAFEGVVTEQLDQLRQMQQIYKDRWLNKQYQLEEVKKPGSTWEKDASVAQKFLTDSVARISAEIRQMIKQFEQDAKSPNQKDQMVLDYLSTRPKSKIKKVIDELTYILKVRNKGNQK